MESIAFLGPTPQPRSNQTSSVLPSGVSISTSMLLFPRYRSAVYAMAYTKSTTWCAWHSAENRVKKTCLSRAQAWLLDADTLLDPTTNWIFPSLEPVPPADVKCPLPPPSPQWRGPQVGEFHKMPFPISRGLYVGTSAREHMYRSETLPYPQTDTGKTSKRGRNRNQLIKGKQIRLDRDDSSWRT